MVVPRDYRIKWSRSDKDTYHMISLICETKKKNDVNELIHKAEIDPQT